MRNLPSRCLAEESRSYPVDQNRAFDRVNLTPPLLPGRQQCASGLEIVRTK